MKVLIISMGKFKKKSPLEEVFNYYKERINLQIDILELKTYDFDKKKKLNFERQSIEKHLKPSDSIIVLERSGKMMTSNEFSTFLKNKMMNQIGRVCFLIGSEIGFDDYFKTSFFTMSLGKQTWPHLLVRIMLIEQIYRSMEIIKGSGYHK